MPKADNWKQHQLRHSADRNDAFNPEVLFQSFARDASVNRSLRKAAIERSTARILDVGCGSGGSLISLLSLGFPIAHMVGVDQLPERVREAKSRIPDLDLVVGDGSQLAFVKASFDLVLASTMFWSVPDDDLAHQIAREMIRVAKRGGILLVCDWRMRDPRAKDAALPKRRVMSLFPGLLIENVEPGPLVLPVGRRLSHRTPSLYFFVQRLIPPLVGMMSYTLRVPD